MFSFRICKWIRFCFFPSELHLIEFNYLKPIRSINCCNLILFFWVGYDAINDAPIHSTYYATRDPSVYSRAKSNEKSAKASIIMEPNLLLGHSSVKLLVSILLPLFLIVGSLYRFERLKELFISHNLWFFLSLQQLCLIKLIEIYQTRSILNIESIIS